MSIYNAAKGFIFPVPGFKKYLNEKFKSISYKPKFNLLNGVSNSFILMNKLWDAQQGIRYPTRFQGK